MQISVHQVSSELLVNTVLLCKNQLDPTNVYLFRCYKCSTGLKQIQGLVGAIYAGYITSPDVVTIDRCYKCAENYTFQTSQAKFKSTQLVISAGKHISTFHCVNCRLPLLQYNPQGAVVLPSYVKLTQHHFNCTSPSCRMSYHLKEIVEPQVA